MNAGKPLMLGIHERELPLLCLVLAGEGGSVLLLVGDFDRAWPRVQEAVTAESTFLV
jgi:uncharacterized lipoprotein